MINQCSIRFDLPLRAYCSNGLRHFKSLPRHRRSKQTISQNRPSTYLESTIRQTHNHDQCTSTTASSAKPRSRPYSPPTSPSNLKPQRSHQPRRLRSRLRPLSALIRTCATQSHTLAQFCIPKSSRSWSSARTQSSDESGHCCVGCAGEVVR